ncbi:MAG: putative diguanylate cyclase DgcQ [Burkholderia plantarii]|nr:MAG: putative diguanylate cyclase DgcQ [Burkholderia plantarii]
MLIIDPDDAQVPAGDLPARQATAGCEAAVRLARAQFGVAAAVLVVEDATRRRVQAADGIWSGVLPPDPFATGWSAGGAMVVIDDTHAAHPTPASHALQALPARAAGHLRPAADAGPARVADSGAAGAAAPRFVAACALTGKHGARIGVLYLLDSRPRTLDAAQRAMFRELAVLAAHAVVHVLAAACACHDPDPRAGRELVALALRGSGTGIWDRDVVTGEIYYSSEWKAILGYGPDELSNRIEDAVERLHPDDRAYVQATMRAHFENQTDRYEVEHRVRCKDGSYKWICSRGKVVSRDKDGRALRMVGATTDVTVLREWAAKLQQSIDLITNLTDEVSGLVFQYRQTADGRASFSYASDGIRQIYELSPEEAAFSAEPVEARIDPRDLAAYRHSLGVSAATLQPWRLEYRVRLPHQGLRWRQGEARPQRLPDGGTLWHGFITDTTERKRIEAELHEFATTDHLTELANRRHFMMQGEATLARLRQDGIGTAAVLMLDLDHFKTLNDRWGHALGDRALRHFAQMLRLEAHARDAVGRIGGEEFAIVLPGQSTDDAVGFARRVQGRVADTPLAVGDRFIALSVSIGIDRMDASDAGFDHVLTRCDKALYLAKARGRNRIELYFD